MKIVVDVSAMPPAVQASVRQLLEALSQEWPTPISGQRRPAEDRGPCLPAPAYSRPHRGPHSVIRPRIVALLREHPDGLTLPAIEQHLDLGMVKHRQRILNHMVQTGVLKRVGRAAYTTPDAR